MQGRNRYERAFAAWLRQHGRNYLMVDETQRHALGPEEVKSPDFLVYGELGEVYVVDVKGRRYPGGTRERPRRVWERWCTRQDCLGLLSWAQVLRGQAMLVFVYNLWHRAPEVIPDWLDHWSWRGWNFGLCGVLMQEYIRYMRRRSVKWDTVSLPMDAFRGLAQRVSVLLGVRGDHELVSLSCSHTFAE